MSSFIITKELRTINFPSVKVNETNNKLEKYTSIRCHKRRIQSNSILITTLKISLDKIYNVQNDANIQPWDNTCSSSSIKNYIIIVYNNLTFMIC